MMNKEQKKNYIEEMTNKFENSKAVMVTHYQGLTMTQLDELRAKMREHGIIFKITKNRITKLALEKNISDPDMLIRTGNTTRLSNFLLWQISYTEIFFSKKLWPDFNEEDFIKMINKFKKIKRNYGEI